MRSLVAVFLVCSLFSGSGLAQSEALYSVTVEVSDHSVEARESALRRALGAVLVRVSGDADIHKSPQATPVLDSARQLVRRFSYAGGGEPEEEGEPAPKLYLKTEFNPRAVNSAIGRASLPLWGGERPATLLAMRSGSGFISATSPEAEELKSAAAERGMPISLPSSTDARGRMGQADLNPGSPVLASLLQEYDSSYLLLGDSSGSGSSWRANWRIVGSDGVVDAWQGSARSQAELQTDAITRLADVFSRQFAVRPSEAGGSAVVAIDRITGLEDYARVMNYFSGMTAVRNVSPLQVSGSFAVFKLELAGSLDNFRRGVSLANWLTEDQRAAENALLYDGSNGMGYRLTR